MIELAYALMAYSIVAGVWDILEPDAFEVEFGSPMRALAYLAAAATSITLVLTVIGASLALVVGYVALILLLGSIGAKVRD
jgi:hypothetical protein